MLQLLGHVSNPNAVCGNGTVETGEQCEPPNTSTCNSVCQTIVPGAVCGNGTVETGEQCDPPNGTTCDTRCQSIGECTLLPFMGGQSSSVLAIGPHASDTTGIIKYCFDVPANMSTVAFAINSGDWGTNQDLIMSRVAQPTWDTWRQQIEAKRLLGISPLSRLATATYWYKWAPDNNESLLITGVKAAAVYKILCYGL